MINSIMSAPYTRAVAGARPSSWAYPSTPEERETIGDTVRISNAARQLQAASPLPTASSTVITPREIAESFSNTVKDVEKQLQSLYSRLGISPDVRMDFSVDPVGNILVRGESPASEALAEAINADEDLSNSIRKMSSDASFLEAMREHVEFAAAYDKDPEAALVRYGYLFDDDRESNASFSMQAGHIDITES